MTIIKEYTDRTDGITGQPLKVCWQLQNTLDGSFISSGYLTPRTQLVNKDANQFVVLGGEPPHKPSSTGKIYGHSFGDDANTSLYYPNVFDLKWLEMPVEVTSPLEVTSPVESAILALVEAQIDTRLDEITGSILDPDAMQSRIDDIQVTLDTLYSRLDVLRDKALDSESRIASLVLRVDDLENDFTSIAKEVVKDLIEDSLEERVRDVVEVMLDEVRLSI